MFKNLTRLSLLDLFEVLTAVACALLVWNYRGGREAESAWILGSLLIAAIVIGLATRIGKTPPIPGLFTVAYIAALYGIADLSPWMSIFGRMAVMKTALWLFADVPTHSWQDRCITAAVIAGLMAIPATFVGAVWSAIWSLEKITRKQFIAPKTSLGLTLLIARFAVAALFVTGLTYYSLRPQIRHVRTIRLPFGSEAFESDEGMERIATQTPNIRAWTISPIGNQIVILRSDRQLLEVGFDSAIHRRTPLHCNLDRPRRLFQFQNTLSSTINLSSWDPPNHADRVADVRIWQIDPDQVLLGFRSEYNFLELEAYDLSLGRLVDRPAMLGVDRVIAVSENVKYFAIEHASRKGGEIDCIAAWNSVTKQIEHSIESSSFAEDERTIAVTKDGKIVKILSSADAKRIEVSDDGEWRLVKGRLTSSTSDYDRLDPWRGYCTYPKLDPSSGKVVLLGTRANSDQDKLYEDTIEAPILRSLLLRAHRSQLTLLDPAANSASTTWLKQDLFRRPDFSSAKFTPDGRHLIIQDEDESSDLFHIFSMP
jgi:hypothetical protein